MKVAIYCRLSEEDKDKVSASDDSGSIKNQKSLLLQYCSEQDWEVYNIYSDDNYAGADRKRPEFNRLLEDARNRKFDIVLCKTQSRFTRELELVEKYIHGLFPIWNIRFISIVDNADTNNKGNKKARQINGLTNEWYLEDMSDSIKSVLTNRRENGKHIGAFALYGYKKDPDEKGHLVIDEEAAAVVREVFTLFSKGYGKTAIARILNDRGVPNPTEYKRLKGLRYNQPKSKNSTLWKYFSISDMLVNETYIGNLVQGKYGSVSYKTKQNKPKPKSEWIRVENTHEPIIDMDLWNSVQSLIHSKAKPFKVGKLGIFAKKTRCASCGYTLSSKKNRGKHYLACPSRNVAKDACIGAFISVERLEKLIIYELNRLSAQFLDKDELERKVEFCENQEQQKRILLLSISNLEKKLDEYKKGISELYMDKVKGIITEDAYIEISKQLTAESKRFKSAIETEKCRLAELEEKIAVGDNRREIIERYTNLEHLTREIVDVLIDYISVGKRIVGTNNVPIEIHWNF